MSHWHGFTEIKLEGDAIGIENFNSIFRGRYLTERVNLCNTGALNQQWTSFGWHDDDEGYKQKNLFNVAEAYRHIFHSYG